MRDVYRCVVCGAFCEGPVHCGRRCRLLMTGAMRLRLSKLMSYILRHDPGAAGVRLSGDGWADIGDLVRGIRTVWRNREGYRWVTEEHVYAVAALDPKGRFEVSDGRIRARYGHNRGLGVRIEYSSDTSSTTLYHGTTVDRLPSIMREGIRPMRRMYVHLSTSVEDAAQTASRHGGRVVVLEVDCECLRRRGIEVYLASHAIRLAERVPPECIRRVLDPSGRPVK